MRTRSILLLGVTLLPPAAALAQSSIEGRLRDALRSANAQLQALQDEQAQWQSKETQYKKDLEAARGELAAARKAARKEGASEAAKKEYEEKLAGAQQALAQCRKEADDAQQQVRAKEDERVQMVGKVDGLTTRALACEAKNARMYRVGEDILDWLGRQGPGAALMAREPFLGLKRVELENIAQDYQDKLLDQRVTSGREADK